MTRSKNSAKEPFVIQGLILPENIDPNRSIQTPEGV